MIRTILNTINSNQSKIAFVCEKSKQTYTNADLLKVSKQIAYKLLSQGVKIGDYVSIELENSFYYFASRLAVWFLGCCCVCLTDKTPIKRKNYVYNLCNINAKIQYEFLNDLDKTIKIGDIYYNNPDDNALVILTSGTQGKPKAVLHSHKSLLSSYKRINKVVQFNAKTIYATAPSPDFILAEVFDNTALINGSTIVITPEEYLRDIDSLSEYICRNKISDISIYSRNISKLSLEDCSLKSVIVAGDVCRNIYSDKFKIFNFYGTSEIGVVTFFEVDKLYSNTPIGKNIDEEEGCIYILDENGNEAYKGELCYAGNISKGYINHDDTRKVFVENPFFSKDHFPIMYKTGDIVCVNEDGLINFVQRNDDLVNINGVRIELSEIQNCINNIENVDESYVCVHEEFNNTIWAYYKSNKSISMKAFIKHLSKNLPKYMIPQLFIKVDEMPLNKNGKIDKYKLPSPLNIIDDNNKPRLNKQIELAKIISHVLDVDQKYIGINTNLYTLGLDSILAISLSVEYKKHFVYLSALDILENPTILKQIELLNSNKKYQEIINYKINNKPNMFFVHTAQTGAETYISLAKYIANDVCFSSIENYNLYNIVKPILHIKELAEKYADIILSNLTSKKLYLGGWCYGGIIAHEILNLLKSRNVDINAQLIMLDSYLCHYNLSEDEINVVLDIFIEDLSKNPQWIAQDLNTDNLTDSMIESYLKLSRVSLYGLLKHKPSFIYDDAILIKAKFTEIGNPLVNVKYDKNLPVSIVNKFNNLSDIKSNFEKYCIGNRQIFTVEANHNNIMDEKPAREIASIIKNIVK